MKKFYFLLTGIAMVLVTVIACEKSAIGVDEIQTVKDDVLLSKGEKAPKVTICHYDADLNESYQITISVNGLNGHDGHEMDNIPELVDGEYIPLVDGDGDGIADCADCYPEDGTKGEKMTWYMDADGDGFGDPDVYIKTCLVRDGYVADNTDCDDDDANLFPYSPGGTYVFLQTLNGIDYYFDFVITSNGDGTFTGDGGYPAVGSVDLINRPIISGEIYANLITLTITPTSEGNYSMVMDYTDGVGSPYTRTFDNVSTTLCDGISSFEIEGHGDWSLATTPFDPTGQYFMYWVSDDTMRGLHEINITTWTETSFSGTGIALNFGDKPSVVEATINTDKTFVGTYSYPDFDVTGEPFGFEGYINKWGGITIRPMNTGEFYGPVPATSDLFSGDPVPTD